MEDNQAAKAMRDAAEQAGENALAYMGELIEATIPDGTERCDHRRVGALILAASGIYGSVLATVVKHGGKSSATLAAGIYQNMIADELAKILAIAKEGEDDEA